MYLLFFFMGLLVSPSLLAADAKLLLENEKNTIQVYRSNALSVVYVSNVRVATKGSLFDRVREEVPRGAGSGIVWDTKGHILTNYHVVAGGNKFVITFHKDKKEYPAVIQGVGPRKDIAILKLQELPPKLTPVKLGNSGNLIVGQKAMALGNPFGLDHSISAGIISALGRKMKGIGGVTIENMIQTDTAINPGNSGGPLLDSQGRLIGVNTVIFSASGGHDGVGFAVPVDTVKRIVPQLIEHGEVVRPGLGIVLLEEYYKSYFNNVKEGVIVKYVDPKHPAHAAGIRGITRDRRGRYYLGDVILAIDKQTVSNYDDIYHVLDKKKVGDVVSVRLKNDKGMRNISTRLVKL